MLPARPCCPGQQESTTTLTNRFRRQGQARCRAITKYLNLPTGFAKNRLDNQKLKFLCRTRFRGRSESRFPFLFNCCQLYSELLKPVSYRSQGIETFCSWLALSKGLEDCACPPPNQSIWHVMVSFCVILVVHTSVWYSNFLCVSPAVLFLLRISLCSTILSGCL